MRKTEIAAKTFLILMLIMGAFFLIVKINYFYAFEFIVGSIASIFFFYAVDELKINKNYKLFIVIAIGIHLIGAVYLFKNFIYYDKILHFIFAIFITSIVSDWFYLNLSSKKRFFLLFIFLSAVGISAVWEIYEYAGSIIFNIHSQGVYGLFERLIVSPLDDTMQDLIISSIGAITALIIRKSQKER